jgi:Ca2+-binding RTX toxin-like protein
LRVEGTSGSRVGAGWLGSRRDSPRTPHSCCGEGFVIGCSVLLLVGGCAGTRAGTRSETSKEQGPTEATHKEQTRSPKAAASEEARCERTRTYQKGRVVRGHRNVFTTNDLPDCPKGGLLLGTDKADKLGAKEGGDEIRGLGAADQIFGGVGKDVIYGGRPTFGFGANSSNSVSPLLVSIST